MSEKIVDELGIDVDSIKTMDDIEDVLVKVHEALGIVLYCTTHDSQMLTGRWTWMTWESDLPVHLQDFLIMVILQMLSAYTKWMISKHLQNMHINGTKKATLWQMP